MSTRYIQETLREGVKLSSVYTGKDLWHCRTKAGSLLQPSLSPAHLAQYEFAMQSIFILSSFTDIFSFFAR